MMQVKQAQKPDEPVITVKQEALIELLLSGIALPAAATQLKVNESTCRRWLKLPHVKASYRRARQEIFDERLSMLRDGVNVALKTLMTCMDPAKTKSEFVRCQAASKWLETSLQVYKVVELEEKIDTLEKLVKERLK
jgi:hypothetical protein